MVMEYPQKVEDNLNGTYNRGAYARLLLMMVENGIYRRNASVEVSIKLDNGGLSQRGSYNGS